MRVTIAFFGVIMLGFVVFDRVALWLSASPSVSVGVFTYTQMTVQVLGVFGVLCLAVAIFWDEIFRYLSGTK
ncbi:MAG: hypothetical protein A2782_03485 [Candidatus Blackburnbacteria bacterium RIFCSPHIGHO2_01_FULL_43_15b]|uniref:Uncharacterized protein n=1 Tax=Candidatus Blackburnbacteria bacterium RIFCSPHIGHO2_01_FULL_43_15b TaxID=1797513 RepID=A0A1G1V2G4_9BACT|nr:MAG: hypothetical protein A2782_03485 [Candidatus Blackburnbacteria bacterium RIFCSPHIGHO2_01_FULL_43_15b]